MPDSSDRMAFLSVRINKYDVVNGKCIRVPQALELPQAQGTIALESLGFIIHRFELKNSPRYIVKVKEGDIQDLMSRYHEHVISIVSHSDSGPPVQETFQLWLVKWNEPRGQMGNGHGEHRGGRR